MAPSSQPTLLARHASALQSRQDTSTPTCVTTCIATANVGTCAATDFSCLCNSAAYFGSVNTCMTSACSSADYQTGVAFAAQVCAAYGASSPTGDSASSGDAVPASSITAPSSVTSAPTIDTTSAPRVLTAEFKALQGAMSAICSLLLLTALFLGASACRQRVRRNREATQNRTWTGLGGTTTGGTDQKSRKFFSRNGTHVGTSTQGEMGGHSSYFTNSRGVTSTIGTVDFGAGHNTTIGDVGESLVVPTLSANGRSTPARFTNRLTLNGMPRRPSATAGEGEEWEMTPASSKTWSDGEDKSDSKSMIDTPTTYTSRMGAEESEVELGSTVHLNKTMSHPM